jgi:hypothetical protein
MESGIRQLFSVYPDLTREPQKDMSRGETLNLLSERPKIIHLSWQVLWTECMDCPYDLRMLCDLLAVPRACWLIGFNVPSLRDWCFCHPRLWLQTLGLFALGLSWS